MKWEPKANNIVSLGVGRYNGIIVIAKGGD